jgi:predicted transposase YdaD
MMARGTFFRSNPNKSQREVEAMLGITLQQRRVYREIKEEGREVEARSLILRLLTRRVGELPPEVQSLVEALSLEQLENLGEALLDFTSTTDLDAWLARAIDRQ